MNERIKIIQADITDLDVDAIVNAANRGLAGGGGVDGAIHRAAGSRQLKAATRPHAPLETGAAILTDGFDLPAKHIIHTVGPVWQGGDANEAALLTAAYRNSLELATKNGLQTIAFPAISRGVYGYPLEAATRIALGTVSNYLQQNAVPHAVTFVCFSERDYNLYQRLHTPSQG